MRHHGVEHGHPALEPDEVLADAAGDDPGIGTCGPAGRSPPSSAPGVAPSALPGSRRSSSSIVPSLNSRAERISGVIGETRMSAASDRRVLQGPDGALGIDQHAVVGSATAGDCSAKRSRKPRSMRLSSQLRKIALGVVGDHDVEVLIQTSP